MRKTRQENQCPARSLCAGVADKYGGSTRGNRGRRRGVAREEIFSERGFLLFKKVSNGHVSEEGGGGKRRGIRIMVGSEIFMLPRLAEPS